MFLIGTLNAPNGPPRVVPWPCELCFKHKNSRYVLLIPESANCTQPKEHITFYLPDRGRIGSDRPG